MMPRLMAELFGTLWLVLGGCGAAVLTALFPQVGIGILGVSFAFGLTVLTMAYAVGHVSGGHFNPAVTLGLVAGGRFKAADAVPYIIAQVIGAFLGAWILYVIATGNGSNPLAGGFASNGFGAHSPGKFSLMAALVCEVVMTFFFLIIILGATHRKAAAGCAYCHRAWLDAHPSYQHPGDQYFGKSGAQHWACPYPWRLGA